MAKDYSTFELFNFLVPIQFEQELGKFKNADGGYQFKYIHDGTIPDSVVSNEATYIVEGVPMGALALAGNTMVSPSVDYPEVIPNKVPLKIQRNVFTGYEYNVTPEHPSGVMSNYQSIMFDVLVDLMVPNYETRADRGVVDLQFGLLDSNFMILQDGSIQGYSPSLIRQFETYKMANGLIPSMPMLPEHMFGNMRHKDTGIPFHIVYEENNKIATQPFGTLRQVSMGYYAWQDRSSGYTGPSSGFLIPVLGEATQSQLISQPITMYSSSYTMTVSTTPGKVTTTETKSVSSGLTPVTKTHQEKDAQGKEIITSVVEMIATSGSTETTQVARDSDTLNHKLGIPVLQASVPELVGKLVTINRPTLGLAAVPFSLSPYGFNQKGITFEPNKGYRRILTGVNYGRSIRGSESTLRNVFLSFPDAVIQELGFCLVTTSSQVKDGKTYYSGMEITSPLTFSRVPFDRESLTPLSAAWHKETINRTSETLRVVWKHKKDRSTIDLPVKWRSNLTLTPKVMRHKVRWSKELLKRRRESIRVRWAKILPNIDNVKRFYKISYSKHHMLQRTMISRIRYKKALTKVTTLEHKASWNKTRANPVIVHPYYVEKGPSKTPCVSYQVYANPNAIAGYLANGEFHLYFSNPPKFELVRFDYNRLPYKTAFLGEIDDPLLDHRLSEIPDNYTFLGNYTIGGIVTRNALSLDIIGGTTQLTEARSFWVPEDLAEVEPDFFTLSDGVSRALPLTLAQFRGDLHQDIVDLDLIILDEEECCFTQSASGTRCSPY